MPKPSYFRNDRKIYYQKILNREITKFSDITEFIRDNYNDLSFKISDLEEYGLSIKIIDTSFEYGLPTIIVLLIDKHKKDTLQVVDVTQI